MFEPTRLHRALSAHLGQELTPERAALIVAEAGGTLPPQGDGRQQALLALCGDSEDARTLITEVWSFVHVWDDAIDGDHTEDERTVNEAMEFATFDLARNRLYRANPQLAHFLRMAVFNWQCANELERRGDTESLAVAYALRCSYFDFFVAVVEAAAGTEPARLAARLLRLSVDPSECFGDYLNEHRKD